MALTLHLLTQPDPRAAQWAAWEETSPDATARVVDLTVPDVDYAAIFEAILKAESVVVW